MALGFESCATEIYMILGSDRTIRDVRIIFVLVDSLPCGTRRCDRRPVRVTNTKRRDPPRAPGLGRKTLRGAPRM